MSTDEKRRARYFFIANTVLFLVGVLVVIIGLIVNSYVSGTRDILINIGSNIVVISLLFFFGRILLFDPQRDVEETLARIETKINAGSSGFITKGELAANYPFELFISQAKDVLVGGIGLRMSVIPCRDDLLQRLRAGANLKFAALDPDSPYIENIVARVGLQPEVIRGSIHNTLANLEYLRTFASSHQSGSVEVRLLNSAPPFSFALRDPDKHTGAIHISFRLSSLDTRKHPSQILVPTDKWYAAFRQECEALWNEAQPWAGIPLL